MHARSGRLDAPERAEKVVSRFRELSNKNALRGKPDEYTYNLLLKCWCVI
jgi:hypothetical protein